MLKFSMNRQISAADLIDSPGLKVLSQLGDGGLQSFCGFAERDVTLFVALRDALQVSPAPARCWRTKPRLPRSRAALAATWAASLRPDQGAACASGSGSTSATCRRRSRGSPCRPSEARRSCRSAPALPAQPHTARSMEAYVASRAPHARSALSDAHLPLQPPAAARRRTPPPAARWCPPSRLCSVRRWTSTWPSSPRPAPISQSPSPTVPPPLPHHHRPAHP